MQLVLLLATKLSVEVWAKAMGPHGEKPFFWVQE
jgi:hypothetical protein